MAGKVISDSALPAATYELVKIRASQINGCGYCTDMHTKDAAHAGETSIVFAVPRLATRAPSCAVCAIDRVLTLA